MLRSHTYANGGVMLRLHSYEFAKESTMNFCSYCFHLVRLSFEAIELDSNWIRSGFALLSLMKGNSYQYVLECQKHSDMKAVRSLFELNSYCNCTAFTLLVSLS